MSHDFARPYVTSHFFPACRGASTPTSEVWTLLCLWYSTLPPATPLANTYTPFKIPLQWHFLLSWCPSGLILQHPGGLFAAFLTKNSLHLLLFFSCTSPRAQWGTVRVEVTTLHYSIYVLVIHLHNTFWISTYALFKPPSSIMWAAKFKQTSNFKLDFA